jgi:serine/threonine protein kinase
MKEDDITIASEKPVAGSLSVLSLNDDIPIDENGDYRIEQDRHYKIENEKCLPFEYKSVLGNGWSAVVEEVEHKRTKERFAKKVIKFPRNKGKVREQAEERYYNEAAIIRSLKTHSHVIRLFATYTTPRSGALILQPAADEGDLQDYLDRYADLVEQPVERSADLKKMTKVLEHAFGCLSSGLAYMHSKGIRHKDIKPGNILMHQGMVVYTDFGASRDTTKDGQCTTEGAPESLTRRYCAPEVLEFDKRNFTADIFSLGCVFIEMMLRLSHLSEPEGLEADGYSGIMNALHILLQSAQIPSKLSFLKRIVTVMTARDSLGRSAADEVSKTICRNKHFSCSDCRQIHPDTHTTQQSQPEWSESYATYLYKRWDQEYQLYYWVHYVEGIIPAGLLSSDFLLKQCRGGLEFLRLGSKRV